jgi:hypothetical protein
MQINNEKIKSYDILAGMYKDSYFPTFLVDKVKDILIELCEKIETEEPKDINSLLVLTHAATEKINDLESEFEENDSELETVARDIMAENFEYIVRAYDFLDVDIENVIAPRNW